MDRNEKLIATIVSQKILPLFYNDDNETCAGIASTLYEAGIRALEFTNRGKAALENFKALVKQRDIDMPELLLGVGTIRTAEQANDFIHAGADFLVSPVFDVSISDAAYLHKTLWIPGCMTATEIHHAANAGCSLVKLFPGSVLGPDFVRAVRPLFPAIQFMPTGGVEIEQENLEEWFDAGVAAVGMGSNLISNAIMDAKNYEKLRKRTRKLMKLVERFS